MKKYIQILVAVSLVTIIVLGALSCGQKTGTVSQADYDALKAQLSAAQTKLAELQKTVLSTPAPSATTSNEASSLKAQLDSLTRENTSLQAKYNDLNTKYEALLKAPSATPSATQATTTTPQVTEEQVETAIFTLINQERTKAGVPAANKGVNLYNDAINNSRAMSLAGKLMTDPDVLYQQVFMAAGYNSAEEIARGALIIWKLDQYNFQHGVLLAENKFAAAAAVKSEDIIYITFLTSNYQ
jgi:cell division protein FtsB